MFAFGDAAFYGSTGSLTLNKPIVAMAATPDGRGYWLVASDGGVFAFGDATFYGSGNGLAGNPPVAGMTATLDGGGYWLVLSNGGVLPYGDAAAFGTTQGLSLNEPVVGAAAVPATLTAASPVQPTATTTTAAAPAPTTTTAPPPTTTTTRPPATTTTTTTTVPSTSTSAGSMAPPSGYSSQQRIFDDTFSGTSLDTSKWSSFLGAAGIAWNDFGTLPAPYSGTNDTSHGGSGNNIEMYGSSQVTVDNGLTLTAQRNTNQWASTYPWISGVVTTEGKISLPTGGWYVQVKAKMPDTSQGMWPAIWFLPGTSGTASNEFDGFEGGWIGSSPNTQGHSDYFANQGQRQSVWASGSDISAGYHVYGYQFIPGQSITAYLDGNRVWQVSASSGITITGEPYEIMLELQVAGSPTSGWHTITNANTPASSMQVAEVQAYSGS